jgi:hypothetical protein
MVTKKATVSKTTQDDLVLIKKEVYDQCGLVCTAPVLESESADYSASTFSINGNTVRYRVAKITPTKTGQFVTLWKRREDGIIAPYHVSDTIDFFIVSVRDNNRLGQFVFPKSVLHARGLLSDDCKEGKRAIRVYPPWDNTNSKQAQKTQLWQTAYFFEIPIRSNTDFDRVKSFFGVATGKKKTE